MRSLFRFALATTCVALSTAPTHQRAAAQEFYPPPVFLPDMRRACYDFARDVGRPEMSFETQATGKVVCEASTSTANLIAPDVIVGAAHSFRFERRGDVCVLSSNQGCSFHVRASRYVQNRSGEPAFQSTFSSIPILEYTIRAGMDSALANEYSECEWMGQRDWFVARLERPIVDPRVYDVPLTPLPPFEGEPVVLVNVRTGDVPLNEEDCVAQVCTITNILESSEESSLPKRLDTNCNAYPGASGGALLRRNHGDRWELAGILVLSTTDSVAVDYFATHAERRSDLGSAVSSVAFESAFFEAVRAALEGR